MSHDSKLQQDVLAELSWEPSVTAAHVGVTANDDVVTLTGHVATFAEKHAAEMAASGSKMSRQWPRKSRSTYRSIRNGATWTSQRLRLTVWGGTCQFLLTPLRSRSKKAGSPWLDRSTGGIRKMLRNRMFAGCLV